MSVADVSFSPVENESAKSFVCRNLLYSDLNRMKVLLLPIKPFLFYTEVHNTKYIRDTTSCSQSKITDQIPVFWTNKT
jgi:hypothetical protein